MRFQRRFRGRGEDGVTLMVAMLVMGVAITLSLLAVRVAITSSETSGRDRQRTVAVNAAEAAVDGAFAALQSAGAVLPCTWPNSGSAAVSGAPDRATANATLKYFKADGTGYPGCPTAADVGVNKPVRARIDGYGTTNPIASGGVRTRHMQALVNLEPVQALGGPLDQAIFAGAGINLLQQTWLRGSIGEDADVYSAGNFACSQNKNIAGSVTALGTVTIQNGCQIDGDVFAVGDVMDNGNPNAVIGGHVLSKGSIDLGSNVDIAGTVLAEGSIAWSPCGPGKCWPNSDLASPPTYTFPAVLKNDAPTLAKWVAAGYTVQPYETCIDIGNKIKNDFALRAGPPHTLVTTTCRVPFPAGTMALRNNLAIFASGGFSSTNSLNVVPWDATPRTMFWIVPVSTPQVPPCNIDASHNFGVVVPTFLYTQCAISFNNNSDFRGQIMAGGTFTANQNLDMTVQQMTVPGLDAASLPPSQQGVWSSYKIDIVYKREMR